MTTWNELRAIFRELQPSGRDGLSAHWCEAESIWELRDAPSDSVLRRFKSAAAFTAAKAGKARTWQAFLHVLKQEEHTFQATGSSMSRREDGTQVTREMGYIPRVCEAAGDYCERHVPDDELDAYQRQLMERVRGSAWRHEDNPTPEVHPELRTHAEPRPAHAELTAHHTEPFQKQLDALREECRLTVEELASKIQRDPTTVSRHISGKRYPQLRTLSAYERVFSKLLGRQVVIGKTPGKRQ